MRILETKVLRGPNLWSNFRSKLIVLKLDLQQFEHYPTNLLSDFTERLAALIPSLSKHHCSMGKEGGFIERMREGTWLGHVVEHVALELQHLAGMDCTFGRTRATQSDNVYHVIFSYEIEKAGLYAAKAAVNIVQTLANNEEYQSIKEDIEYLKEIAADEGLGPSTWAIVQEAQKRDIPWYRPFSDSLIMLGYGKHQKKICAALTSNTGAIAVDLVSDKELTKHFLSSFHIPTPQGFTVKSQKQLSSAIKKLGFPLAIKPRNGNHGRGVTTNVKSEAQAEIAYKGANKISSRVIVEKFIEGFDYRFLVINHELVAVAKRKPASVIGNGSSSIRELIEAVNLDPNRGSNHEKILTKITVDNSVHTLLQSQGFDMDSILSEGEEVYLKYTANLSTGGTAIDVTNHVHPFNKILAERISRIFHLDICGIDIIAKDIRFPLNEHNGAVIEVNAAPGLRMHFTAEGGGNRNVAKHIVDMLYPNNAKSRIPIIAVTGTNGKTTTVRLLAHLMMQAGHTVGYTTTDGIYINHHQIRKGDCSGPISAQNILRDPTIDYAVLECARGGILDVGLGFDKCDISIITNISEDHLGLGGIETLEDLARVKSVVAHSTADEGYAILNADDDLVYDIREELICNVALFSMDSNNTRIKDHCRKGGLAAFLDKDHIVVRQGDTLKIVSNTIDIPLTFSGKATFMIQNILPAILCSVINNYEMQDVTTWLKRFLPSAEHTPGRMNLFNLESCKVLVDYGHNVPAFLELKKYFEHINCNKKIGIFGTPGDRRNEDIEKLGFHSAQMFDEIIIRHDKDGRGRTNHEITNLLKDGIMKHNPEHDVTIISDEREALDYALKKATSDHFIAYFPEDIFGALEYLKSIHKPDTSQGSFA